MKSILPDRCGYEGYRCTPEKLGSLGNVFKAVDFLRDTARARGSVPSDVFEIDAYGNWIDNYLNIPVKLTSSIISLDHVLNMNLLSKKSPAISELSCADITPSLWNLYDNGYSDDGYDVAYSAKVDYSFKEASTPSTWHLISQTMPSATACARYTQSGLALPNSCAVFPPPVEDDWTLEPGLLEPMLATELTSIGTSVPPYNDNAQVFLLLQLTKWRQEVNARLKDINNRLKHIWALRRLLRNRNISSICSCFKISTGDKLRILRNGRYTNSPTYSVSDCDVKVNGESRHVSGRSGFTVPSSGSLYWYLNAYAKGKDENNKIQYELKLETSAKGILSVGIGGVRRIYGSDGGEDYTLYEIQQARCRADMTLAQDYSSSIDQSTSESSTSGGIDDSNPPPPPPPPPGVWQINGPATIYPYVEYTLMVSYDGDDPPESPNLVIVGQPTSSLVSAQTTQVVRNPSTGYWEYRIMVTTLDRSLRFVIFAVSGGDAETARYSAAYALFQFVPNIVPDTVHPDELFNVEVTVQAGGTTLTEYTGGDLYTAYMDGTDTNGETQTNIGAELNWGGWSNGKCTGTGNITAAPMDPMLMQIALHTEFLDEPLTDTAAFEDDRTAGIVIYAPDRLHIYGEEKPMTIEVTHWDSATPPANMPSAAAYFQSDVAGGSWVNDPTITPKLQNASYWFHNVQWIDVINAWGWMVSGKLRIVAVPPGGDPESDAVSEDIVVSDSLDGTIDIPENGVLNTAVPMSIALTDPAGDDIVQYSKRSNLNVRVADEEGVDVTTAVDPSGMLQRGWTRQGTWTGSLTFTEAGHYTVELVYYNEVIAQAYIYIEAGTAAIFAPDYLHVYGPAKQLTIQALAGTTPPAVHYTYEGEPANVLLDAEGLPVDFGTGWNTQQLIWRSNVMCATGLAEGVVTIYAAAAGAEEEVSEDIDIENSLTAALDCGASGTIGETLSISVLLKDAHGAALTRFTGDRVSVTVYDSNDQPLSPDPIAWDAGWSVTGQRAGSMAFSEDGVYTVKVEDSATGDVLCEQSITIRESGEVTVTVTSPLHIYGTSGTLSIVISGEGVPEDARATVSVTSNGAPVDINDYMELSGGGAIDFTAGWSNARWSYSVQAKTSASAAELIITAAYGDDN